MKPYSIFIEDLKADKEEFNTITDYDMGISNNNPRVTDLEVAHGMALTTVSFEFECFLNIELLLSSTKNSIKPDTDNRLLYYNIIQEKIKQIYNTTNVMTANKKIAPDIKIAHPDYWFIEPDTSIRNGPDTHIPVEIVSPWIPAKDAVKFVTQFKNEIGTPFDIKTNRTTSLHCSFRTHITDRDNKFPLKLNVLKLLALLDEKEQLERFNRKNNIYIQPIQSVFSSLYNTNNLDDLKQQLETALSKNDKYHSINFTDFLTDYNLTTGNGRIEIRIIGDDYMGSLFNKAMRSLNEFILLISSALDNDLHKKEYKDKLNKKLKNSGNSIEKQINKFKEVCNDYIQETDFIFILSTTTTVLNELLVLTYELIDDDKILKLSPLIIKLFNKLSQYIDINLFTKKWIKTNNRIPNNFIVKGIFLGQKPFEKIYNAIDYTKQQLLSSYEILISWAVNSSIELDELHQLITNIIESKSNEKLINKCIEVINYAYFDTTSIFWKNILNDIKQEKDKKRLELFNKLFANYLKD